MTIQAASIDTRNENRDNHLRSPDFFDAASHPQITFKSRKFKNEGGVHSIIGELTIKGVTKLITIPVEINGPVVSPMGGEVIGLSGTTTINRQDFGISWNKQMDQGGWVVGNDVKLLINIEAKGQ